MFLFLGCGFTCRCMGGSSSGGCSLFTLATTYFARVVRCTAIAWSADCRSCNHDFNHFSRHNDFSFSWSRLSGDYGLDYCFNRHHFRSGRLCCRSGFNCGRLGNWLAYNADFLGRLRCFFESWRLESWSLNDRSLRDGFDDWLWSCYNRLGDNLDFRVGFLYRCNFNFRCLDRFDRRYCFDSRCFYNRSFNNSCFYSCGCFSSGCLSRRCFYNSYFLRSFSGNYGFSRG